MWSSGRAVKFYSANFKAFIFCTKFEVLHDFLPLVKQNLTALGAGGGKQATITVINMLLETNFTTKKIAAIAAVDIAFVEKWAKASIKNEVNKTWDSFKIEGENKQLLLKRTTTQL